ncbi:MAG: cell division protein SepF [Eubacteriales bacterium]
MGIFSFGKKTEMDTYDGDGYYDDVTPVTPVAPAAPAPTGNGLTLDGKEGANLALKLVRPESFEEVSTIADYLLEGCTVFLNLEAAAPDVTRRILDFLTGVAYAGQGQIQKGSASTYIISPKNVDVSDPSKSN